MGGGDGSGRGPWRLGRGEGLIFLAGLPRSGTTLLQRLLGSHSQVHTLTEPWLMLHPLYALRERGIATDYGAPLARAALREFLGQVGRDEELYREAVRALAAVLYGAAMAGRGERYFLDKTPRYYHVLPELARTFPGARILVLLRNPLAVLSSMLARGFGEGLRDRPEVLRQEPFMMTDLRRGPRLLARALETMPERCLAVRYETLVEDPEGELRRLCSWLGLAYEPAMVTYGRHRHARGRFGDPFGAPAYDRPVTAPRDRWREHLRQPRLRPFALAYLRELGPGLLRCLGYDPEELEAALEGDGGAGASDPAEG